MVIFFVTPSGAKLSQDAHAAKIQVGWGRNCLATA